MGEQTVKLSAGKRIENVIMAMSVPLNLLSALQMRINKRQRLRVIEVAFFDSGHYSPVDCIRMLFDWGVDLSLAVSCWDIRDNQLCLVEQFFVGEDQHWYADCILRQHNLHVSSPVVVDAKRGRSDRYAGKPWRKNSRKPARSTNFDSAIYRLFLRASDTFRDLL